MWKNTGVVLLLASIIYFLIQCATLKIESVTRTTFAELKIKIPSNIRNKSNFECTVVLPPSFL